jgi:hypothetical protein
VIVGNLRRRDTIPLIRFSRRFNNYDEDLSYRRTRDIREDRRFEVGIQ